MKKLLLLVIMIIVLNLVSCDSLKTDYYFGDYKVYHEQEGTCEPLYMDLIYMDNDNDYFLTSSGCTMTDYYIVHESEEIDIETAIMLGYINIDDILASNAPFVEVQAFTNEEPISADVLEVGTIGEYTIMRSQIFCEAVVGMIIVDGYDFGYFSSGCSADLNSIGYYAVKDDNTYNLKQLVDDGEFSTLQIFELYRRDEGRWGRYDMEVVAT